MRTLILPYKAGSKSAKVLADALGVKRISLSRKNPQNSQRILINWGNTGKDMPPEGIGASVMVLNHPDNVRVASDKLQCLQAFSGADVRCPQFTTETAVASMWLEDDKEVVERHILNGSSGRGINIVSCTSELSEAPLYTKYIKKMDEYRIHVIGGVIADVQRKAKRTDQDVLDWKIRNHANGFVFIRQGLETPDDVFNQALSAMDCLGLDFGAVDVIWNAKRQKAYVLEVNTAPALEGSTIDTYVNGIRALLDGYEVVKYNHTDAPDEVPAVHDNPSPFDVPVIEVNRDSRYNIAPAVYPQQVNIG